MTLQFSVLISVYFKEKAEFLEQCLHSIFMQSLLPAEVVIVKDGPLTDALEGVLAQFSSNFPRVIKILPLPENKGLGIALQHGLSYTTHDIVARMDGDDICHRDRFLLQRKYLQDHPECDIVGSSIAEFEHDPSQINGYRKVPETHEDIFKTAHWKCPMNHMTVMFRKHKVVRAGGYQHLPFFEDYALWVRMLQRGMNFYNLQQPLVLARVGNDMIGRRHGWQYVKREFNYFKNVYKSEFITLAELIVILLARLPLRLVPKAALASFYKLALRKSSHDL